MPMLLSLFVPLDVAKLSACSSDVKLATTDKFNTATSLLQAFGFAASDRHNTTTYDGIQTQHYYISHCKLFYIW